MNEYDRLVKATESFERVLLENRRYGTADSEAFRVFRYLLLRAIEGGDPYIPLSQDGWELYDIPGSSLVANQLHAAATAAVDALKTCPMRYARQVGDFVNGL